MYKVISKESIFKDNNYEVAAQTSILIHKENPLSQILRVVDGDFRNKTDDECIEAVLEKFYQETYLNRAEKEQITEIREATEEARKASKEAKESSEKNTEKINKAIADMTTLITTMLGGVEENVEIEEGGEDNAD